MTNFKTMICMAFALAANSVAAADAVPLKERVMSAIEKVDGIEPGYTDKWAFTKTISDNGDMYVETFNPANENGKQWILVSVNQKAPDQKKLEQYQAVVSGRNKLAETGKKEGKKWMKWMIDMDSIRITSETPEELHITFTPLFKGAGKEDSKKLAGKLVISNDGNYVRTFDIWNTEPISPNFATTINEMKSGYVFQKIKDGPYMLLQSTIVAKGKIAGVKTIDSTLEEKYGSYVRSEK